MVETGMILDRIGRHLVPRSFLCGFAIGLISLSVAGAFVSEHNIFKNFVRFHDAITPATFFLPTAREVAALVNSRIVPGRTLVIIGGSSVMRGHAQSVDHVWTRYLQEDLGSQYVVINLAMNGGGTSGIGSYMAERLVKSGTPVIYVSDYMQTGIDPRGSQDYYWPQYFQSAANGYLIDYPQRDSYIRISTNGYSRWLGAELNLYLYFNEIWNTVAYRFVSTVYSPYTGGVWWLPRKDDMDMVAPQRGFDFRRDMPPEQVKQDIKTIAEYARPIDPNSTKQAIANCFPPELRRHMIITDAGQAPYRRNQLSEADHAAVDKNYRLVARSIGATGITSAFADQIIDDDDHADRVHLSEPGGRHLAEFLTPYIIEKAKELGYAHQSS